MSLGTEYYMHFKCVQLLNVWLLESVLLIGFKKTILSATCQKRPEKIILPSTVANTFKVKLMNDVWTETVSLYGRMGLQYLDQINCTTY